MAAPAGARVSVALASLWAAGLGAAAAEEWSDLDPTLYDDGVEARIYEDIDLPEDPAGLPDIRWDLRDGGTLQLYGHINRGWLRYDDGRETETYVPIDNSNSPSRVGLRADRPLDGDWSAGFRFEVGYGPFATFFASQLGDDRDYDLNRDNVRWLEVSADNPRFGRISIGQGSMATDGITLVDFSATSVVAYSSVGDSAGGQFLRFSDPGLPIEDAPRIRQAFFGLNGPRRTRIRYDTPTVNGLGASVAYGRHLMTENSALRDEDLFDAAVTYGETLGNVRVGVGVGYFLGSDDREVLSGSASVLHAPSGLNLTVAGGRLDTGNRTSGYLYGKLGYLRDVFGIGDSALSLDYYAGSDIVVDGSESDSWGLAYVQFVDRANTELWLTVRRYAYDEPDREFEDGEAVYGGLRFRF